MPEIDHSYTREVVCPYCGYEFSDSWEFDSRNNCGVEDCGECGKEFSWVRDVEVTYTTEKSAKEEAKP